MIWFWMLLVALAALAPLALALRRPTAARGRRAADLLLYRAQLAELDADLAAGRLDPHDHTAARLEVQRRLLASPEANAGASPGVNAETAPAATPAALSPRLLAMLLALPLLAMGLYLATGTPDIPSAPYAERRLMQDRDETMLAQLRARLDQLDPTTEQARQGWLLLGNLERNRGNLATAALAYQRALLARFDADAAAQLAQLLLEDEQTAAATTLLAEAMARAPDHVGLRFLSGAVQLRAGEAEAARRIWQALLADAPAGAPWAVMVERRLAQMP